MSGMRIKTYLNAKQAEQFVRIRQLLGFKSDYEMFSASIRLFLSIIDRVVEERQEEEDNYIEKLFSEFAYAEDTTIFPRSDCSKTHLNIILGVDPVLRAKKDRGKEIRNKEFADRFVKEHYAKLSDSINDKKAMCRGTGREDIFHEVLVGLYTLPVGFNSYEEFCAYAIEKFNKRG